MTADDALLLLAEAATEAASEVLRETLADGVEVAAPGIVAAGSPPLDGVSVPALAAEVRLLEGANGGFAFVTSITALRRLAAAVLGTEADGGSQDLDEAERTGVTDLLARAMNAAAAAMGERLGSTVGVSAPALRELETVGDLLGLGDGSPHTCTAAVTLGDEDARLVLLVPKAYIARLTRADVEAEDEVDPFAPVPSGGADEILRGVPLRVCAEIGRASMPLAQAVSLPGGGLVELDRGAEEPVDVMVNGRRFATGRLVLVENEWAVRIEEILLDAGELQRTELA